MGYQTWTVNDTYGWGSIEIPREIAEAIAESRENAEIVIAVRGYEE